MAGKTCARCGNPLPAPHPGAGRPRKYCTSCRRPRIKAAEPAWAPPPADAACVADAVAAELRDAGVAASSAGQAAMVLARRLDDAGDDMGGSALAALARGLQEMMTRALAGAVETAGDPLDELMARRERRSGA